MKNIYLKKGKEDSLNRFHPWIFSGAIHHMDDGIEEGETVKVIKADGSFIALGHYQIGSIAVRVLSFEDEPIDEAFWTRALATALDVRITAGMADSPTNNTYRLVHGEGDFLPGLVIDCYGKTAVMQAHSVGMHVCRFDIASALMKVMGDRLQNVYYKSETTLPFKADLGEPREGERHEGDRREGERREGERLHSGNVKCGFIVGNTPDDIATENGLKFHVDWLRGQKTGFFVDQRENRSLLESYSKGRKVLNMFCYTGGFSFYAMRGGAELVHSVDSSEKAISLTNANVELNFPGDPRHQAFCEDAFKFLEASKFRNLEASKPRSLEASEPRSLETSPYDLIILDPPAFAKHRAALHNALKGYTRLNLKALQQIKPGGILFTFSCSQVVTKEHFRNAVFTACAQSGRKVRILHQLHQPADHPISIYHPEGEYLKGLVLYVE